MNDTTPRLSNTNFRLRLGLVLLILGLVLFFLGVDPWLVGLDRSPVTGFVQIAVFEIGLALICIGGYIALNVYWNGHEKTIAADIGIRLVATGYVISIASGLADVFGIGSHPFPNVPSFGTIQTVGVMIGEVIIALGFLLFIPWPSRLRKNGVQKNASFSKYQDS
jgi:hypothetical protein